MSSADVFLTWALVALGGLGLATGLAMLRWPAALRRGLETFPRSKWPGWLLTAFCVVWMLWVLHHAALGRFDPLKPALPFAAVAFFAAVVFFLDELLAPRALGGVLLLVSNPLLMGIRWAESPWRFVVALMAYAWVVAGCALMLHPWLFRRMVARFLSTEETVRRSGWLKLAGGALLLAAGLWHLR